jgi:hypothetical protein
MKRTEFMATERTPHMARDEPMRNGNAHKQRKLRERHYRYHHAYVHELRTIHRDNHNRATVNEHQVR